MQMTYLLTSSTLQHHVGQEGKKSPPQYSLTLKKHQKLYYRCRNQKKKKNKTAIFKLLHRYEVPKYINEKFVLQVYVNTKKLNIKQQKHCMSLAVTNTAGVTS